MALTRLYPTDLLGTLLMDADDDDALHSLPSYASLPLAHCGAHGTFDEVVPLCFLLQQPQSLSGVALAFLLLLPVTCFMSALRVSTLH